LHWRGLPSPWTSRQQTQIGRGPGSRHIADGGTERGSNLYGLGLEMENPRLLKAEGCLELRGRNEWLTGETPVEIDPGVFGGVLVMVWLPKFNGWAGLDSGFLCPLCGTPRTGAWPYPCVSFHAATQSKSPIRGTKTEVFAGGPG
jgi:hypothetical protein